jgi:drug/metabolite transporter (DMT)-like permease
MVTQASYILGFFFIGLGLIWVVTQEAHLFFGRDSERPWRIDRSRLQLGYTGGDKLNSAEGTPMVIAGIVVAVFGIVLIIFPEFLPTALENLQDILGPFVTIKTSP